jgi:molecular chaperone GrpE (heat shock protein)
MFGLGSMEKRLHEKIKELEAKIEELEEKIAARLLDRFDGMDELLQQSIRQERRNRAALESVFENQKTGLSMLRGIRDESKAIDSLIAFAEGFALLCQSQPESPECQVLWAKLVALLDLFGLEILAETGVPFDPSLHEAGAVRFDPYEPEGYVLELIRPGFLSGGDVLRYASVVVNRPAIVAEHEIENWTEGEAEDALENEFEEREEIE